MTSFPRQYQTQKAADVHPKFWVIPKLEKLCGARAFLGKQQTNWDIGAPHNLGGVGSASHYIYKIKVQVRGFHTRQKLTFTTFPYVGF